MKEIEIKNLCAYENDKKEVRYNGEIHFKGYTSKEIEEIVKREEYNDKQSYLSEVGI